MNDEIVLAESGRTAWRIVMGHPAHETVKLACDELHHFIMEMSGASLPVQTELVSGPDRELIIGPCGRLAAHGVAVDWDALGDEEYVIFAEDSYILLAGRTPRATLYAVYAFLEEELGCRWFASDCALIPRVRRLTCRRTRRTDKPAFESREAFWHDAFDGRFAVRSRMNSNKADISVRQGGRLKFFNFSHSMNDLIPPDEYFDTHPEYFSMVDGARRKDHTQLCLTNPDVLRLCVARVKQWIRDNPDCTVFSVAQNDWENYCTCPDCAAVDAEEGSHAGTMIRFVNQVAEAIEAEYPHVLIHTFAYRYTRKAPRLARPRHNVIVRLCSIECCFSHPLDGKLLAPLSAGAGKGAHPQCAALGETAFLDDLRAWSRITDRLYVWDYVTQFRNYLLPMPNFDTLQSNLRLFRDIGVRGILEEGNFSQGGGGHLAELEAYLQAKLMWNPDCDVETHMREFLAGYYGEAAAPLVREYIEMWQQAARPWHVGIYETCRSAFITDELIRRAVNTLSEALFLTADPAQRKRLNRLLLGMTYLTLCRMPPDTPGRDALIDRFGWELREAGISEIRERMTPEESLDEMRKSGDSRTWTRRIVNDYKV
ncbi:MAG: DUF4838 domain-containing protein [Clostridia bacterium]|nr:DUF4838 domain-containing protein [Clostridia bacterium]